MIDVYSSLSQITQCRVVCIKEVKYYKSKKMCVNVMFPSSVSFIFASIILIFLYT